MDIISKSQNPDSPALNIKVGHIIGTKDSAPFTFYAILTKDHYLQLDDIIMVEQDLPYEDEKTLSKKVCFYGIVSNIFKKFEGITYHNENLYVVNGTIPSHLAHIAEISLLRVVPEIYIPPTPGNSLYHVKDSKNLAISFYTDKMQEKIAAGFLKNGSPFYINEAFLNGKNGAHISISGISGVATKTSFASFLLFSLLQKAKMNHQKTPKVIIFNVKGEDLLFLDQKNIHLEQPIIDQYAKINLKATPFSNVGIYTSARPTGDGGLVLEGSLQKSSNTRPYAFKMENIIKNNLFPFFFKDAGDSQLGYTINRVNSYLRRAVLEGNIAPTSLDTLEKIYQHLSIDENLDQALGNEKNRSSSDAFMRRLYNIAHQNKKLIHTGKDNFDIQWQNHDITVIDIHKLSTSGQMFVVSTVVEEIYRLREDTGYSNETVYIVLDELNKYAPRTGSSPIKDTLIDIAERGRSLGICLVGAQQNASEVEKRVYSNSAIKVIGRIDPGEIESTEYKYLPSLSKKKALLLSPGEMILYQPDIPYPIPFNFPFPSWATKSSEIQHQKTEDNKTTIL